MLFAGINVWVCSSTFYSWCGDSVKNKCRFLLVFSVSVIFNKKLGEVAYVSDDTHFAKCYLKGGRHILLQS